jgi:sporulation protein YlmC with PRC-barrel domain
MSGTDQVAMAALGEGRLALAQKEDDVRGMSVVDPHGHRVGVVGELVIDEEQRRARLLIVSSGGICGLAVSRRLVPVEAVSRVDDQVHIDADHEDVHRSMAYHPERPHLPGYHDVYSHYGYPPFWEDEHPPSYFHTRC